MEREKVAKLILKQIQSRESASEMHAAHKRAESEDSAAQTELSVLLDGHFEKTEILRFQVKGQCFEVGKNGHASERVFEEL